MHKKNKVVLAYSGGLDTSCIVQWLKERDYEVICFLADLGQQEDFKRIKKQAIACGASRVYIKDLRDEFVTDFVVPAIKANAVYEQKYLLATALGRPLIAKYLVEVAQQESAGFIAHGCTGKGNDQVRIELAASTLDPTLKILAPVREWEFTSREEEIEYARKHNIPVSVTKKKPYSLDKNLWGVSIECGILEDPAQEPPEDAYQMTVAAEKAPNKPQYVRIGFERGVPVRIDGKKVDPIRLIDRLNIMGAAHGVGRSDLVENRVVGIKSREIYESPAGWLLLTAHRELEALVLDQQTTAFKQLAERRYGELVYQGLWFSPLKEALDALIERTQEYVSGDVRLKLFKGTATVVGRSSVHSLYNKSLATYTKEDRFDQKMAEGFIGIMAMPYKQVARQRNAARSAGS